MDVNYVIFRWPRITLKHCHLLPLSEVYFLVVLYSLVKYQYFANSSKALMKLKCFLNTVSLTICITLNFFYKKEFAPLS